MIAFELEGVVKLRTQQFNSDLSNVKTKLNGTMASFNKSINQFNMAFSKISRPILTVAKAYMTAVTGLAGKALHALYGENSKRGRAWKTTFDLFKRRLNTEMARIGSILTKVPIFGNTIPQWMDKFISLLQKLDTKKIEQMARWFERAAVAVGSIMAIKSLGSVLSGLAKLGIGTGVGAAAGAVAAGGVGAAAKVATGASLTLGAISAWFTSFVNLPFWVGIRNANVPKDEKYAKKSEGVKGAWDYIKEDFAITTERVKVDARRISTGLKMTDQFWMALGEDISIRLINLYPRGTKMGKYFGWDKAQDMNKDKRPWQDMKKNLEILAGNWQVPLEGDSAAPFRGLNKQRADLLKGSSLTGSYIGATDLIKFNQESQRNSKDTNALLKQIQENGANLLAEAKKAREGG